MLLSVRKQRALIWLTDERNSGTRVIFWILIFAVVPFLAGYLWGWFK